MICCRSAALTLSTLTATSVSLGAPTFTLLPGYDGYVTALDPNGTVGVGFNNPSSSSTLARYWIPGGPSFVIPSLGGTKSSAGDISDDGLTVVGSSTLPGSSDRVAFRWTPSGGTQSLGTLGGNSSTATGVSRDGSVVIGSSRTIDGVTTPYRWTAQTGMVPFSQTAPFTLTSVSADLSRAAGIVVSANGQHQAVQWTASSGRQVLDFPPNTSSDALGVSANGQFVFGQYKPSANSSTHIFRWSESSGVQDIPVPAGGSVNGYAISGDGSMLGGFMNLNHKIDGFIWTAETGMVPATSYLQNAGVELDGWRIWSVNSISDDGRTVAGQAFKEWNWYPFIVTGLPIPAPSTFLAFGGALFAFRRQR